jgi:hypothetical protein
MIDLTADEMRERIIRSLNENNAELRESCERSDLLPSVALRSCAWFSSPAWRPVHY